MTGDCHVRFCERLRGETPLCLLGALKKITRSQPTVGRVLWALLISLSLSCFARGYSFFNGNVGGEYPQCVPQCGHPKEESPDTASSFLVRFLRGRGQDF